MSYSSFLAEWNNECNYIVAHTSGSTGIPKEIHLSKKIMRSSAQRTIDALQLPEHAHLHIALSTDYIAGKMMAVRAILLNGIVTTEKPSNSILHNTTKSPIDLLAVIPSQLPDMLDRLDELPQIKNILVGGSAISPSLRKHLQKSGLNAYETYGMTETASHVALRHISTNDDDPFTALPGISFRTDKRGCLVIDSEDFHIITNDIVKLFDKQNFVPLGRFDNVIITGGIKVNPEQLERLIAPMLPDNSIYIITSRPHPKWTNEIVLILEEPCLISDSELITKLRANLAHHLIPKQIIRTQRLPRTASGKLYRKPLT